MQDGRLEIVGSKWHRLSSMGWERVQAQWCRAGEDVGESLLEMVGSRWHGLSSTRWERVQMKA